MDVDAAIFLFDANVQGLFLFRFEIVAVDEELGDRATHEARQHQPKRGACNTNFRSTGDAVFFGKDGSPGDGGAVAAYERHGAAQNAHGGFEPQSRGHANAREILYHHKHHSSG